MAKTWKVIKKTLLWAGIAFVVLSLSGALLVFIYQDDIKAMAVKQVNANLNAKVIISGADIDITFLSTFPNAAIEFRNFKVLEPGASTPSTGSGTKTTARVLLEAKRLDFEFSPLDLINKHYHISRILLSDAVLNLRIDENGNPNYNILKPDTSKTKDTTAAAPLDIKLKHIRLKNVKLSYRDLQEKQEIDLQINDCVFAGNFTDAQYDLKTDLDLVAENVTSNGKQYLKNKKIVVDGALSINKPNKKYSIQSFKLKFENAIYDAKGSVQQIDKRYLTDLSIDGADAGIQTLISLLPNNISTQLKDYQSTGQVSFKGRIKGYLGKNELPDIDFKFGISNGGIHDSKHSLGLESVNLSGEYSNGKSHDAENSYLHINHFTAKLNGRPLDLKYSMDNFIDPTVQASLNANIDLKDLRNFITIPGLDSLSGEVRIDASFSGKIADLKHFSSIGKTRLEGKMQLSHVTVKPTGQKFAYKNLSGHFETNGNDMDVTDFGGTCGRSDFKINGTFKNLASFLFLPNQALNASTDLQCHYLNLDDFMIKSGSATSSSSGDEHFNLPAFMYFNFNLKADKLVFGRFEAENISGSVLTAKSSITLKNITMNTMSGTVQLNGNIVDADAGKFVATAHASLSKIDVKKCFYEFDNFGQDYFTDKYIFGRIDATLDYKGLWNKDLSPDTKSIICDADVTIYDGEVNQFPPFIRLGKFLKVKSLDDIHFSEYTNKIQIINRVVTIPKMEIKSNAVSVTLSGTHTFDNYMDYHLKVNMSQMYFGDKKDYEDEFGEVEVDKNGGINVPLIMKGTVDNYVIKYDTKSSIKNIGEGFKEEGKEIKQIFNKPSSPNAKPGEDLNRKSDDVELSNNESDDDNDGVPKKTKPHAAQDSARNNAYKNAFKKLKNNH